MQADQMHMVRFGERQGFTNQTSQALSESVVEVLNMSCQARAFADGPVLSVREHGSVGFPEVAVKDALPVAIRDGLPKLLTGCLTSPAHDAGAVLAKTAHHKGAIPTIVGAHEFQPSGPRRHLPRLFT